MVSSCILSSASFNLESISVYFLWPSLSSSLYLSIAIFLSRAAIVYPSFYLGCFVNSLLLTVSSSWFPVPLSLILAALPLFCFPIITRALSRASASFCTFSLSLVFSAFNSATMTFCWDAASYRGFLKKLIIKWKKFLHRIVVIRRGHIFMFFFYKYCDMNYYNMYLL